MKQLTFGVSTVVKKEREKHFFYHRVLSISSVLNILREKERQCLNKGRGCYPSLIIRLIFERNTLDIFFTTNMSRGLTFPVVVSFPTVFPVPFSLRPTLT